MNLFLKPFVEQALRLHENGILWEWNGILGKSYLHPLGCCVDTSARAALLNMSTFAGYDGGTYCKQKGVRIDWVMKWVFQQPGAQDRTDKEVRAQMIKPEK